MTASIPADAPLSRPDFWSEETLERTSRGESARPEFFRWCLEDPGAAALVERQRDGLTALGAAYDNDGLFDFGWPDADGPAFLARLVDHYADAGARYLAFGAGSSFAWTFTPRVMETPWADDPAFAHLCWAQLRAWRVAGRDPLTTVLARARQRQLPLYANIRFNRYHPDKSPPLTSRWFVEHPEYWLSQESYPFVQAGLWKQQFSVDLAIEPVREHLAAELLDVVEHYPVDGLQLELLRAVPFFELDEPEKKAHLADFLGRLRAGLDRAGDRAGRRLHLALWLPAEAHLRCLRASWPERFFGDEVWGLDPAAWIDAGLVDVLVIDAYNGDESLAMAGPLAPPAWLDQARQRGVAVLGGCLNCAWQRPAGPGLERYLRAARAVTRVRADYDGIFFFNTQPVDVAELLHLGRR